MKNLNNKATLIEFIRNLREGIYITNAAGVIVDCNPAFLEMFGAQSIEELGGYTAEKLMVDAQQRREELDILERDGAMREFELAIRRLDGQQRIVLDTAHRVVNPETDEILYYGILVDITERKHLERQLREQAIRDPLTDCYNRHYLAEITKANNRGGSIWGVIITDIDNFKEYNDRHGHAYGDRILIRIARFFKQEVRCEDPVFRMGGDEFMIFLPGLDEAATREVVDRLKMKGPAAAPASFSLGWAIRENRESLEETMRRADHLLLHIRIRDRKMKRRRSEIKARKYGDRLRNSRITSV